jgi:cell division ATPase FtsA
VHASVAAVQNLKGLWKELDYKWKPGITTTCILFSTLDDAEKDLGILLIDIGG